MSSAASSRLTTRGLSLHGSLCSGSDLGAEGIFVKRTEPFLLGVEAPSSPHDPQAGHDWNRKIDAQYSRNLSPGQHAEDGGQWMQLHALSHYPRRNHVVLYYAPGSK